MKRRTVVHICTDWKGGGAEKIVYSLLNCSESDIQVEGVYFGHPPSYDEKWSAVRATFLGNPIRSFKNLVAIRRYVKGRLTRLDAGELIVHAHLTWPLYYVAIATLGLGVKLIYTEHSTFNKRRRFAFLRPLEKLVYSRYNVVVAISAGVQRSLINWLGQSSSAKVELIPNGVALRDFESRANLASSQRLKLISVGTIKPSKGFETTIRAVGLIKRHVASYTIVGDGAERAELENLCARAGLSDIVKFTGWLDDPGPYYDQSDILLIPSHWEGFGLVAIEGLSTGLPVVASNVEGLNDVLASAASAAILVDEFTHPYAWAEEILSMSEKLTNDFPQVAVNGRLNAEKFSVAKMCDAHRTLYLSL